MKTIGRNDPCPCGSGKKYKKCCLTHQQHRPVASFTQQKIRQTEGFLVNSLIDYGNRHFGHQAILEAWDEFTCWNDIPFDPQTYDEIDYTFMPWFVFNWVPENIDVPVEEHLPEQTIAEHYLEHNKKRIDSLQQRFIDEATHQLFSFYVVESTLPGQQMTLKDLFLGKTITVLEKQASATLSKGHIIFARIITLDQVSVMLGCGTRPFPVDYLSVFLDMKEDLLSRGVVLDEDFLLDFDLELREVYFDIREELANPQMPELANTDGDPLQPTKLIYKLDCTVEQAFEALASLSLETEQDMLLDAEYDAHDQLTGIDFNWMKKGNSKHAGWDNTLLGHLQLSVGKLIIEVNSQNRADQIQRKVTRRLGKMAHLQNTVIESMEYLLKNMPASGDEPIDNADLMAMPEVQEKLAQMSIKHWQQWLDMSLPALKNMTPREAAKSAKGRERLEVLFMEFESHENIPQPFAPDIDSLRKALGLV